MSACSERSTFCAVQYLVFEYVERNLLEILEEHPGGLDGEQASQKLTAVQGRVPSRSSARRRAWTAEYCRVCAPLVSVS